MADLYGIGTSALIAYRRALDTVSNNIANVNTEGYSRQRIDLQARSSAMLGLHGVGNGVDAFGAYRVSDRFVFQRLVRDDMSFGRLDTLRTYSAEVDGWLSDTDNGLSAGLESFFDGVNETVSNPTSTTSRNLLISNAGTLTGQLADLQNRFDEMDGEVTGRIRSNLGRVNEYAAQLAELNDRIAQASINGGEPSELMDQREQTLRDLAGLVGYTTTTTETDGSVNVFVGNGQALVLGRRANTLELQVDDYSRPRDIVMRSGQQATQPITQQLSGGELGGLLDFRREVLEPAINDIGRTAVALASAFNAQHRQGVDQYGELGGDFFDIGGTLATASRNNGGSARATVGVSDSTQLNGEDYTLSFDGAGWQLRGQRSGELISLDGSGTADDPLRGAGLSIVLEGEAAAGDRFLVQPTRYVAGAVEVAISDPARIAAAAPLQSLASTGNSGSATISAPQVLDIDHPALGDGVSIRFGDDGTYTINDQGPFAYVEGEAIEYNGWRVNISGTPAAGDTFEVGPTGAGSGDNSNALSLVGIADLKLLDNGRNRLSDALSNLVSRVGSQTQQATVQAQAQETLRAQTEAERDSISGVNLDEEAADLTRYEQAYQAAAQVISVASSLFDTLLAAVRR